MSDAKILGGEFEISSEMLTGEFYQEETPKYSLGRTCLYAILQAINGGVLLPDYICASVAEVPKRLGLPIKHYHILDDFNPDYDSIKKEATGCKSIVLVSYFGLVNNDDVIVKIRRDFLSLQIIVDDVQNYYGFGNHVDYDFCFSSYRKWFSTPDGAGVLQRNGTKLIEYNRDPDYIQYKAAGNLLKNYSDWIGDSVALESIEKGEEMMGEDYLCKCSDISCEIFKHINHKEVQNRRKQNAKYLHGRLSELGVKHIYDSARVSLFIPIIINDRNEVRRKLFCQNIFAPVHWPVVDVTLQGSNDLYEKELSLICDQRYDEEDMERIIQGIKYAL